MSPKTAKSFVYKRDELDDGVREDDTLETVENMDGDETTSGANAYDVKKFDSGSKSIEDQASFAVVVVVAKLDDDEDEAAGGGGGVL